MTLIITGYVNVNSTRHMLPTANMDTTSAAAGTTSVPSTAADELPEKRKTLETSAAHGRARSSPPLFPTLPCVLVRPLPPTFSGRHRPPPPPDTPTRPCSQSRKTANGLAPRRRCTPPPSQSLHDSQRGAGTTTATNANSATTSARTTAEKSALKQAPHRLGLPGKSRSAGEDGLLAVGRHAFPRPALLVEMQRPQLWPPAPRPVLGPVTAHGR